MASSRENSDDGITNVGADFQVLGALQNFLKTAQHDRYTDIALYASNREIIETDSSYVSTIYNALLKPFHRTR